MNYLIRAMVGQFPYYVSLDESYAVPYRKWTLTGLKNNGSFIPNKTTAEDIRERIQQRCSWPLDIITYKPHTPNGTE